MFISKKDLKKKKRVKKGPYSIVFDLGNDILAKQWINLGDDTIDKLIQKVLLAGEYQMISNLAVPIDILETEDGIVGFLMRRQPGISFVDHFNAGNMLDLDEITDYVYNTEVVVKECNEHDMFFPDLASDNLLYDPITRKSYIIDYDGAQIKGIRECSLSDFIAPFKVISSRKYLPNGVYDRKIDMFTLAVRYFYYTTKLNISRMSANKGDIKELINLVGLQRTQFADLLLRAFDYDLSNGYIGDAIQELKRNYTLSPNVKKEPRIFIKM